MIVRRIVPNLHAQEPAAGSEFYPRVVGFEPVMDHGWIVTYAAPDNPAAQNLMREDASAAIRPAPAPAKRRTRDR